jgi:hypothetical protein
MYRGLHGTDAGMHCIWEPSAFESVVDYDTWSEQLLNDSDIARHISDGHFVPLNIGDDGGMEIEVRFGVNGQPATLSEREKQFLIVKSEPYKFLSKGKACISGIEHVTVPPARAVGIVDIPAGEYAATIHLLAWDEEPGMQTDAGPADGALPDYLVLINPSTDIGTVRTSIHTFESA